MTDSRTLAVHDGQQLAAARVLAGLTVRQLAAAADTTTRTVSRLELGGPVYVAARKRHGHVELALWQKIVEALARRGVELVPEADGRGAGVRWTLPRDERSRGEACPTVKA